jgi:hypothetical protein
MTKKIVGAGVGLAILLIIGAFFSGLVNNRFAFGYNDGYEPTQPIPYSHKFHAGTLKIDCKYCHTTVEQGRHASVPSLNVCMNCHSLVKKDSPALTQLKEAYLDEKSIEWQKVHLLPDFVKFNHSAHIKAGKQCTECHGAIEEMEVVKQKETLSMGWCVNCHRAQEKPASIECGTCHY